MGKSKSFVRKHAVWCGLFLVVEGLGSIAVSIVEPACMSDLLFQLGRVGRILIGAALMKLE